MRQDYDYNNRLQLVRLQLGSQINESSMGCWVYNYYANKGSPTSCSIPSQGSSNDGDIVGTYYNDAANSSLSHTAAYAYDPTHRLTGAAATGNSTYNLAFSFDRYGNMTCSQNQNTNGPCPQYSFNSSTNQISNSGYTYDASGDLTGDGVHTYQYDAEGRMSSVDNGTNASYIYNALGQRVEKDVAGTYTEYLFDGDGNPIGENNRSGWTDTWLIFNGQHVAHYQNGETYFMHANNVGTTAFVTDYSGAAIQDETHYPWGEQWKMMGTMQEERYAGMRHRDAETGLDPTQYRMHSSSQYRWLTPDPSQAGTFSPHSMSRYSYANGNPVNLSDPSGLIALSPGPGCEYVGTGPDGEPDFWCDPIFDNWSLGAYAPGLYSGARVTGSFLSGPFSWATYVGCAEKCFGGLTNIPGSPGRGVAVPSYLAASYIVEASQGTGESAAIIGATWAAESDFQLSPADSKRNGNGTVDVGPMQLNTGYLGKDVYHPAGAYGSDLAPKGGFNGNIYLNIYSGARYLKSLGSNPQNYVGARTKGAADRQAFLNTMVPKLTPFFNCLEGC